MGVRQFVVPGSTVEDSRGALDLAQRKPNVRTSRISLMKRVFEVARPMTMETRCCKRIFEFQRYPPLHFCTARYELKSLKKKFQT